MRHRHKPPSYAVPVVAGANSGDHPAPHHRLSTQDSATLPICDSSHSGELRRTVPICGGSQTCRSKRSLREQFEFLSTVVSPHRTAQACL